MGIRIKRQQDVKFTCDMCKAEISNSFRGPEIGELRSGIFYLVNQENTYHPLPQPLSIYSWELCGSCTNKVKEFILESFHTLPNLEKELKSE